MFRLLILCSIVAFNSNAQNNAKITESEKAFFLNFLDRTETDLIRIIGTTSEQEWGKSMDGQWSPGQIVTHILAAEGAILTGILQLLDENPNPSMKLSINDAWLLGRILDRGVKVKTPLDSNPPITSRKEAGKLILESHKKIRKFIDEDYSLRSYVGQSPY